MSTLLHLSPRGLGPRRGLPRWAWALIALFAAATAVAVSVAVFAARGRDAIDAPPLASGPPVPVGSPPAAVTAGVPADGCLGGATELDRAVLAAQAQAPLDEVGAAAFAATVTRWAVTGPAPPFQAVTGRQVLSADATDAARRLSHTIDPQGSTAAVSFLDGRYYVEFFDRDSAIVSYLARVEGTLDGAPLPSARIAGTVHLEAVNGTWHLRDRTSERPIEDLQRIGDPYAGGC